MERPIADTDPHFLLSLFWGHMSLILVGAGALIAGVALGSIGVIVAGLAVFIAGRIGRWALMRRLARRPATVGGAAWVFAALVTVTAVLIVAAVLAQDVTVRVVLIAAAAACGVAAFIFLARTILQARSSPTFGEDRGADG